MKLLLTLILLSIVHNVSTQARTTKALAPSNITCDAVAYERINGEKSENTRETDISTKTQTELPFELRFNLNEEGNTYYVGCGSFDNYCYEAGIDFESSYKKLRTTLKGDDLKIYKRYKSYIFMKTIFSLDEQSTIEINTKTGKGYLEHYSWGGGMHFSESTTTTSLENCVITR